MAIQALQVWDVGYVIPLSTDFIRGYGYSSATGLYIATIFRNRSG
ncbi:hypothetical protein [Daejeonella sp.]